MLGISRLRSLALAALLAGMFCKSATACDWYNIPCAVGAAFADGVDEKLEPRIIDLMQRLAPALIDKLRVAVDQNIFTAEDASKRVLALAVELAKVAAVETGDKLLADAQARTMEVEKTFIKDIDGVLAAAFVRLDCKAQGINLMLDHQQALLEGKATVLLQRLPFVDRTPDMVEMQCRKDLSIPDTAKPGGYGVLTTYKMFRCIRLAYVSEGSPPQAISDACAEAEQVGKGAFCALQNSSETGAAGVTEIRIDDGVAARVWARAAHGG